MAQCKTQLVLPPMQSLFVAFLAASLILWTVGAVAQAPNPFLLQWGHDGVNNLSPPTSAVSTTIGPFAPGTPLSITVTTLNNVGPGNEYFSKVRLIWSGRQEDFMANPTMEYGLECLPFTGTSANSQVVWDFAAATMAPFTGAGLEIAFFFQMNGVIGNVQASNLILTVELTDNLFAVTQKSFLVQIAQPAPTPSPTLPAPTPTPTPTAQSTATPTPTPTVMPATGSTAPTPTPSQTLAPTNTPTPTPTQTRAPTNTPTPTPTQTSATTTAPTPTPTQTSAPTNTPTPTPTQTSATTTAPTPTPTQTRAPTTAPTPTPSKTSSPASTTPAPTAATCPYQPAASAGNPCFSADGHTSWFCADPAPQCAQNAANKCLPTQGYPFHNAAGQAC